MAEKSELQIVIEAVNKASKELDRINNDLKDLSDSTSGAGDSTKEMGAMANIAAGDMAGLALAVGAGAVGATIAIDAFNKLKGAISSVTDAIKDATIYAAGVEQVGIAMKIVANNAGITAEEVVKVRDSLVEQNITTKSANTLLRDLIRNQMDYKKATELVIAVQNIASAERMSTSESIERVSEAISSGSPYLLKQMGLVQHLDEIYEKYGETAEGTSGVMDEYARKQAIMNYIIDEGAKFTGAYEASMQSATKVIGQLIDRVNEVTNRFGSVFTPALTVASTALKEFVEDVMDWAKENEDKLEKIANDIAAWVERVIGEIGAFFERNKDIIIYAINVLVKKVGRVVNALGSIFSMMKVIGSGIEGIVRSIISGGKIIYRALRGDWGGVVEAGDEYKSAMAGIQKSVEDGWQGIANASERYETLRTFGIQKWWENIDVIDKGGWEDRLKEAEEGGRELTEKEKKTLQKRLEAWEKYQDAVKKATESYERRLEELAISHRDTWEQIKEDIQEEKELFDERLKDRKESFEDAMEDMAEKHKDKTQSILDDIQDERDAMQGQIDDISEEWNSLISLTEQAGEIRIANLEKQLAKEVALGENADQDKIASLEEYIANAKLALDEATQDQEDAKQEEVDEVKNATEEKIAELEKELEEEKAKYADSVQDKKESYQEDVENYREAHEKKLSGLEEKLAEEKEIRERHRKLFDEIGNKQMQDDITRLKESHERRLEELEYQYEQQIEGLRDMENKKTNIINEAEGEQQDAINETNEALKEGTNLLDNYLKRMTRGFSYSTPKKQESSIFPSWYSNIAGFQHGGIVSKPSIVGEKNYPEVVLPLGEPGRMNQILKSLGNSNMGERKVEQHFHITVKRESDIDMIMEKAAFNMKYK